MTAWSGRAVSKARAYMATQLPAPCGKCGKPVTKDQRWAVGHKKARSTHPELTFVVSNWQAEHRRCSDASGQQGVIAKAKAEALRSVGAFPRSPAPGQSPPRPVSPSGAPQSPLEIRSDLAWSRETLARHSWLAGFLQVPEEASPPLAMTPVHPEAVGSYGAEAIAWIEKTQGIQLRWWQRLATVMQLAHREDGSLCWRVVVESCPRRSGKSVRLRGLALWRMDNAALFGEPQIIVHCGNDLAIVRQVQRGAWRWAETVGWSVMRANGKEEIATPSEDRWLARATSSVYGWDTTLGLVDESWAVEPGAVDEGLEPSMLERSSPQLVLTSTSHRRATSLMRKRLGDALSQDDGETLLLLWAARPQDDPADPATWRAASPHWSADRERTIRTRYAKALAGEVDPEADDPDPMAGFVSQYLNVWRLKERKLVPGDPVTTEETWSALTASLPRTPPNAVAVESWYDDGVSVARAWRAGGRVAVAVTDHPNLAAVAQELEAFRGRVLVGESIAKDPALTRIRTKPMRATTRASAADLMRLLAEDAIRHDGGQHLAGQVLSLRTVPGVDGPRLRSNGRADAVKAACWAIDALRSSERLGRPRILMPTS